MSSRITMERTALRLLGEHAAHQLALPKNRAKGPATEPIERLVRMAQGELDEVLHAIRSGRGRAAVLAELGDAAATIGLAMWAMEGSNDDR